MTQLTYMPNAEDGDTTVVSGVTFHAYETIDVPDTLAARLDRNPWFTTGTPDVSRKAAWAHARGGAIEALEQLEEKIEAAEAVADSLKEQTSH